MSAEDNSVDKACRAATEALDAARTFRLIADLSPEPPWDDNWMRVFDDAKIKMQEATRSLKEAMTEDATSLLSLANPSAIQAGRRVAESHAQLILDLLPGWQREIQGLPDKKLLHQLFGSRFDQFDTRLLGVELQKEWRRASKQVVPKEKPYSAPMSLKEVAKILKLGVEKAQDLIKEDKIDVKVYGDRMYRLAIHEFPKEIPSDAVVKSSD